MCRRGGILNQERAQDRAGARRHPQECRRDLGGWPRTQALPAEDDGKGGAVVVSEYKTVDSG